MSFINRCCHPHCSFLFLCSPVPPLSHLSLPEDFITHCPPYIWRFPACLFRSLPNIVKHHLALYIYLVLHIPRANQWLSSADPTAGSYQSNQVHKHPNRHLNLKDGGYRCDQRFQSSVDLRRDIRSPPETEVPHVFTDSAFGVHLNRLFSGQLAQWTSISTLAHVQEI